MKNLYRLLMPLFLAAFCFAAPAPPTANRIILQLPYPNGDDSFGSGDSSNGGSPTTENGKEKTVNVKGYTTRNGTVVAPYKRSQPN